ncbi:hypothetical protein PALB_21670 [Pseudoalteromonas luteoviolacea B = ATCC 29581]|nr:hypothetical protein PALB_21670 [Pseudoalteromonas luteoviolacea B = ATCC 29581]
MSLFNFSKSSGCNVLKHFIDIIYIYGYLNLVLGTELNMITVFIPTVVADIHALAVKWALEKKGHKAIIWYGNDLPDRASISIECGSDNQYVISVQNSEVELSDIDSAIDIVWLRRPSRVQLPEDIHDSDVIVAQREWKQFENSFFWGISPNADWINPMHSLYRAESKPIQLQVAKKIGFKTPITLFSNNPSKIRSFLSNLEKVVFKPFTQGLWINGEDVSTSVTTIITQESLPDDDVLCLCPGIFQELIDKKYELRVTVMGHEIYAAKIETVDLPKDQVDTRIVLDELPIFRYELPQEIKNKCINLMQELNIVFGCFDFAVDQRGDYIFLEINQMGQFLWLEEKNKDFNLLDSFTNFIISENKREFKNTKSKIDVTFKEFLDKHAKKLVELEKVNHKSRTTSWHVLE